jgi:hypothetical protein
MRRSRPASSWSPFLPPRWRVSPPSPAAVAAVREPWSDRNDYLFAICAVSQPRISFHPAGVSRKQFIDLHGFQLSTAPEGNPRSGSMARSLLHPRASRLGAEHHDGHQGGRQPVTAGLPFVTSRSPPPLRLASRSPSREGLRVQETRQQLPGGPLPITSRPAVGAGQPTLMSPAGSSL